MRSLAGAARLTRRAGRGRLASCARFRQPAGGDRHAALQPAEPVREGVDSPQRSAHGLGEPQRVLDHGARRDEVAAAVLVELGQLLPRPRIEPGVARGLLPERAGGVPAGEPLFPARQVEADRLRRRAREPGLEGAAIARQRAFEVDRLPESAEPAQLPGVSASWVVRAPPNQASSPTSVRTSSRLWASTRASGAARRERR